MPSSSPDAGTPPDSTTITALLVDDEPRANDRMRKLLAAHPEIEVSGVAGSIAEARAFLETTPPDVLFLDVEMPGGMTKMPGRPPEMDGGEYPQSNIFGHTPGYAFYVRYADGVVFENVTIRAAANDVRPWLATEDAGVETINCVELKKLASYKEISIR